MDFEWDEQKRLKNIEKHGIDFVDSDILFGNPYLVERSKRINGEERLLAIGMIDEIYFTAIFTKRGPIIRIISMRRARHDERKKYQEIFRP